MHGIFAFTAFDFSVASSGVLPLFGSPAAGAVSRSLGWLLSPLGRAAVPAVLTYVMMTPAPSASAEGGAARGGHTAKLTLLTVLCRGWFFLALPVLYIPPRIPPGAMFLGMGSAERLATEQEVDALLGPLGASAVRCAAAVTLAICILNGLGPYGGWKTAGTFTTLYRCAPWALPRGDRGRPGPSVVLLTRSPRRHAATSSWRGTRTTCVESRTRIGTDAGTAPSLPATDPRAPSHARARARTGQWTWPFWTRVLGMPWCSYMTDLVTVTDTDAPEVRVRISVAQITKLVVFRDLLARPEWRRAAFCFWAPVPPAWHTLLEHAEPALKSRPVLPYQIPFHQLRCLVSEIVQSDPDRDFFVEYVTGDGRARRFSRRKGRTHYKSDARLAERPHVLQRCCAYRALPLEDDERDLVHTS